MSLTNSQYIKSATGGDIVQDINGYRIHKFTTVGTSTFTPAIAGNVEVLVVAGGGGSGGGNGGAGGAGGLIYSSSFQVSGAVTVTVGGGGAGGVDINTAGTNGGNSIFSGLTAIGGGGGGGDVYSLNGQNGGSGGGGGAESTIGTPGNGTAGQGNNGGIASQSGPGYGGGGGGGAGAIGGDGTGSIGGKGGDGLSYSISGSSVYYAGGGGGGVNGGGTAGTGGLGGGGNGATSGNGQNGTANTGGGGGAGGSKTNGVLSNGGSGIVIVRYPITMTLVGAPSLQWPYNGSNMDSVTNLGPTSTLGTQTYVPGAYGQAIYFNNSATGGTPTSNVVYSLPSIFTANNFTISTWIKPYFNTASPFYFGNQHALGIYDANSGVSFNMNGTDNPYIYIINRANLGTGLAPNVASLTWFHNAVVFSNVGGSIPTLSYYFNGNFIASRLYGGSAGPTSFLNTLTVGCVQNSLGGNFAIQDLRLYNTALSPNQVTNIYKTSLNFLYPLSLTSIVSSALGLYSTRTLLPAYGGPVVQIRRGSDNTTYDFKSDPYGNLSNLQFTTNIASFLSGTTGYISTWYDQSGGSTNFSQATTSKQPQIAFNSGQWVMYMPNQSSNLTTQTMTGINGLMTILLNFSLSSTSWQSLLGNTIGSDTSTGFRFNGANVRGDSAGAFRTGSDFLGSTGSYWYLNNSYGTLLNPSTAAVSGNGGYYPPANWNQVIGTQGSQSFGSGQFNTINPATSYGSRGAGPGYISEMMLFSGSISATDAGTIWNNSPLINSIPPATISLTGTPLFSQLSSAAAASAMGAFSLRAVNGLSAKAVSVIQSLPPAPFTSSAVQSGNQFTQVLGSGTYIVNCSSFYSTTGSDYPWYCFDKNNNGTWWTIAAYGSYTPTTGAYTGSYSTTISGSAYLGEWIQIQLPVGIPITSYTIYNASSWNGRAPKDFKLAGSNDGTTWTLIDTQTGITSWASYTTSLTFTPSTQTTAYTYFRLCVNATNGGDYYLSIGELILNVNQDFYADRLGNLLTAPVTGQTLSSWLGGATGYVATWYDQSGKGNHATQATAANQPVINLTTNPYSLTGGGWVTIPTFSFNFGNGAGYSLRMVVGNTVGGCVVYKGTTAFGWTTDYKHWSFGPGGGSTSETANGLFPYAVGYNENWTYSGTAITTAKTSVTYVAINNTQNATTMYINASQVGLSGSYTKQTLGSDPQPAFVIGNGGVSGGTAPFNGNIYEVIVFSTPLSANDVTIMG